MENPKNNKQFQIELKDEVAQGTYANLAVLTHSSSEFIVDFVRIMPGLPKANVQSRIILTPEHAKRLLFALQENILKYEHQFGSIKLHDMDSRNNSSGDNGVFGPHNGDISGEA